MGYEATKSSITSSFSQTGLDYIDLYGRLVASFPPPPLHLQLFLPALPITSFDINHEYENRKILTFLTPRNKRYLIHAPYGGKEARRGTWLALLEAQQAGRIRSLGVSNYGVHHLDELESYIHELEAQHGKGKGGEISVGQWELHPWLARPDIVGWCRTRGVVIEAYCPIVRGQRFEEPVLKGLGEKYGKTAAQVLLRWSLQKVGFAVAVAPEVSLFE